MRNLVEGDVHDVYISFFVTFWESRKAGTNLKNF